MTENSILKDLDIEFLTWRYLRQRQHPKRETGMSSEYIVSVAYGVGAREHLPGDKDDLAACEQMWLNLPEHRKTPEVIELMTNARNFIKDFR